LQHTKPSVATQGALISVFPESRQQVVTALENLYQGTDIRRKLWIRPWKAQTGRLR
jgi:sn-glycerol 3-phosphate transport system substrate-binding protein